MNKKVKKICYKKNFCKYYGRYFPGWPHSLEIRENRENGQNKFPAGKNQGISKFKKNQGIIREFYKK